MNRGERGRTSTVAPSFALVTSITGLEGRMVGEKDDEEENEGVYLRQSLSLWILHKRYLNWTRLLGSGSVSTSRGLTGIGSGSVMGRTGIHGGGKGKGRVWVQVIAQGQKVFETKSPIGWTQSFGCSVDPRRHP